MTTLLVIGECMLELKALNESSYHRSFAGDTYNVAVYANRWQPSFTVSYMTAIGTDPLSEQMLNQWLEDGLDCSLVSRVENALPGLYLIDNDENGERSFSYWRKNSAATHLLKQLKGQDQDIHLPHYDFLYFSGITLAILSESDKELLLKLIKDMKDKGTKVAFDPNYRPVLWRSPSHARSWIKKAYEISDIALPGLDEHETLFQHYQPQQVRDFLHKLNVKESVVKCGERGICCYGANDSFSHLPFVPASNTVDTTAAGDSFAGTYVASRMTGLNSSRSAKNGAAVAGLVVQHPGAIVEMNAYHNFVNELNIECR